MPKLSTLDLLARITRENGTTTAEFVRQVQAVMTAAESFVACVGTVVIHEPWTADEAEGFSYLRDALEEARW